MIDDGTVWSNRKAAKCTRRHFVICYHPTTVHAAVRQIL